MWFKNFYLYQLTKPWSWSALNLQQALEKKAFHPCSDQQSMSMGFAAAIGEEFVHQQGKFQLICLKRQERLLPSTVVNEMVADRVEALQQKENRKVGRKERLELKEQVTFELLPKAFVRSSRHFIVIDIEHDLLWVASGSAKRADEMTECLRGALESLPVVPVAKEWNLGEKLNTWLGNPNSLPAGLEVGEQVLLKQDIEGTPSLKVSNMELDPSEFQQYLQDKWQVEQLAVKYQQQVECVLASDGTLKRIKYADELVEKAYDLNPDSDPIVQADADFTLCTQAISTLIQEAIQA